MWGVAGAFLAVPLCNHSQRRTALEEFAPVVRLSDRGAPSSNDASAARTRLAAAPMAPQRDSGGGGRKDATASSGVRALYSESHRASTGRLGSAPIGVMRLDFFNA